MGKYKSHPAIISYLSARPDAKEGRFIQVGNTLLQNEKYKSLSAGARLLYLCMAMEAGGRTEFLFPKSIAVRYSFSPASFWRYIKELETNHFILVYSNKNLRAPNRYRFCLEWKSGGGSR